MSAEYSPQRCLAVLMRRFICYTATKEKRNHSCVYVCLCVCLCLCARPDSLGNEYYPQYPANVKCSGENRTSHSHKWKCVGKVLKLLLTRSSLSDILWISQKTFVIYGQLRKKTKTNLLFMALCCSSIVVALFLSPFSSL